MRHLQSYSFVFEDVLTSYLYKHDQFEMQYQLIETFPFIVLSLYTKTVVIH